MVKPTEENERQINMSFNEMHERCGISSSHWRTLQSKSGGDPEYFDWLIEDYKRRMAERKIKEANREKPIPASEYDGYVLSKDEFCLAVYEYIPTVLANLTKKKSFLQNKSAIGPLEDLQQDIYVELCGKIRKKSGKTMYEKYLDNVNTWKGYKQLVFRTAEHIVTDRIKKVVRDSGKEVSLNKKAYSNDNEMTVGDLIASTVNEHEEIFIRDFIEQCKGKEIKGVSLYDIITELREGVRSDGVEIKLRDICKRKGLNIKKVREAFAEMGAKEMLS